MVERLGTKLIHSVGNGPNGRMRVVKEKDANHARLRQELKKDDCYIF